MSLPYRFNVMWNVDKIDGFLSVFSDLDIEKISDDFVWNDNNLEIPYIFMQSEYNEYSSMIEERNLERGKDWYLQSDIIDKWIEYELTRRINGRKLTLWGCGFNGNRLLTFLNDLEIDSCIDSNPNVSSDGCWKGIRFFTPKELNDDFFKNRFVFVTSDYYEEIRTFLANKGCSEFEDFLSYKAFDPNMTEKIKQVFNCGNKKYKCPVSECSISFKDGHLYLCPYAGWSDSIGSVDYDLPKNIFNGTLSRAFKQSIQNKTNCFCNIGACDFIFDEGMYDVSDYQKWYCMTAKGLKVGVASYDDTCNLYCASCRDHLMGGVNERKDRYHRFFVDHIFPKCNVIKLTTMGEAFASKYYRELMKEIIKDGSKSLELISNGILAKGELISDLSSCTKSISVSFSVDAATELTYQKLRRGGDFAKLMKNIEDVGVLRKRKSIAWFTLVFVVQKENYLEMKDFVKIAEKNNVDSIQFIKLDNWGMFSDEEFEELALVDRNRNPIPKLMNELDVIKEMKTSVKIYYDRDVEFSQEILEKLLDARQ